MAAMQNQQQESARHLLLGIRDVVVEELTALEKWPIVVDRIVQSAVDRTRIKRLMNRDYDFNEGVIQSLEIWWECGDKRADLLHVLRQQHLIRLADSIQTDVQALGVLPPLPPPPKAESGVPSASRAIRIVDLVDGGSRIQVHWSKLASLLRANSIQGVPVCIVGAFGAGSTFVLNYMSRFLKNGGGASGTKWMADENLGAGAAAPGFGFGWVQHLPFSQHPGINLWPTSYKIRNKDGKQVVVYHLNISHPASCPITDKLFEFALAICDMAVFVSASDIEDPDLNVLVNTFAKFHAGQHPVPFISALSFMVFKGGQEPGGGTKYGMKAGAQMVENKQCSEWSSNYAKAMVAMLDHFNHKIPCTVLPVSQRDGISSTDFNGSYSQLAPAFVQEFAPFIAHLMGDALVHKRFAGIDVYCEDIPEFLSICQERLILLERNSAPSMGHGHGAGSSNSGRKGGSVNPAALAAVAIPAIAAMAILKDSAPGGARDAAAIKEQLASAFKEKLESDGPNLLSFSSDARAAQVEEFVQKLKHELASNGLKSDEYGELIFRKRLDYSLQKCCNRQNKLRKQQPDEDDESLRKGEPLGTGLGVKHTEEEGAEGVGLGGSMQESGGRLRMAIESHETSNNAYAWEECVTPEGAGGIPTSGRLRGAAGAAASFGEQEQSELPVSSRIAGRLLSRALETERVEISFSSSSRGTGGFFSSFFDD